MAISIEVMHGAVVWPLVVALDGSRCFCTAGGQARQGLNKSMLDGAAIQVGDATWLNAAACRY